MKIYDDLLETENKTLINELEAALRLIGMQSAKLDRLEKIVEQDKAFIIELGKENKSLKNSNPKKYPMSEMELPPKHETAGQWQDELYADIMNIEPDKINESLRKSILTDWEAGDIRMAYKMGHWDAKQAAAELVATQTRNN